MLKIIKVTLALTLLTISYFSKAQTGVKVLTDVSWRIIPSWNNDSWLQSQSGYESSQSKSLIPLKNNLTAAFIKLDTYSNGVTALDSQMKSKWLTKIPGHSLAIGLFKEKIIAISATDIEFDKTNKNNYDAYLLDPNNGKILLQKKIYEGNVEFIQQPQLFFSNTGLFFKMAIRVTNYKNKSRGSEDDDKFKQTQSFTFFELDEQLNVKNSTNPIIKGSYSGSVCNEDGNIFIRTYLSKQVVQIALYKSGITEPIKQLQQPIDITTDVNSSLYISHMQSANKFLVSKSNSDIAYLASFSYSNAKKSILSVIKFDFAIDKTTELKEIFDKEHISELEKKYDFNLSKPYSLNVFDLNEYGNKIFVTIGVVKASSASTGNSTGIVSIGSTGVLLNVYDKDLKPAYQHILNRDASGSFFGLGMFYDTKSIHMIYNSFKWPKSSSIYTKMDPETGEILKTYNLDQQSQTLTNLSDATATIWLKNSFVISYLQPRNLYRDFDSYFIKFKY
jgi:hypothetical protein